MILQVKLQWKSDELANMIDSAAYQGFQTGMPLAHIASWLQRLRGCWSWSRR